MEKTLLDISAIKLRQLHYRRQKMHSLLIFLLDIFIVRLPETQIRLDRHTKKALNNFEKPEKQ